MRGSIKRSIVTSTINLVTLDENLEVVPCEPMIVEGDYSDKVKAQKLVNSKFPNFTVTSVDTEKAVYAISKEDFMKHAQLLSDEEAAEDETPEV